MAKQQKATATKLHHALRELGVEVEGEIEARHLEAAVDQATDRLADAMLEAGDRRTEAKGLAGRMLTGEIEADEVNQKSDAADAAEREVARLQLLLDGLTQLFESAKAKETTASIKARQDAIKAEGAQAVELGKRIDDAADTIVRCLEEMTAYFANLAMQAPDSELRFMKQTKAPYLIEECRDRVFALCNHGATALGNPTPSLQAAAADVVAVALRAFEARYGAAIANSEATA